MRRLAKRLRGDRRGVTAVEFGLLAGPFFMILLVLFDFAYRSYVGTMVEGTVHRAARLATIGNQTPDQIDEYVRSQLSNFTGKGATITITKKSYSDFSGVGVAEKFQDTTDPNSPFHNGTYDPGEECYFDDNHNGVYDYAATAGSNGLGGSDDIVYYTVKMEFSPIVPVNRMMGWPSTESVTSSTVLRNQPYGSQVFAQCKK